MSWRLTVAAVRALRADPEMLAVPLLTGVFYVFVLLCWLSARMFWPDGPGFWAASAVAAVLAVAGTVMFEGALVSGVFHRMTGGDPTVRSVFADVAIRLPQLWLWGLVNVAATGTVRLVSRTKLPLPAAVHEAVLIGWRATSYLTVPAIIIDHATPAEAMSRSVNLLRTTWGANLSPQFGSGAATAIAGFPLGIFIVLAGYTGSDVLLGVAAGLVLLIAAAIGLLIVVVRPYPKTALYLWARDGLQLEGFDVDLVKNAFAERPTRQSR